MVTLTTHETYFLRFKRLYVHVSLLNLSRNLPQADENETSDSWCVDWHCGNTLISHCMWGHQTGGFPSGTRFPPTFKQKSAFLFPISLYLWQFFIWLAIYSRMFHQLLSTCVLLLLKLILKLLMLNLFPVVFTQCITGWLI